MSILTYINENFQKLQAEALDHVAKWAAKATFRQREFVANLLSTFTYNILQIRRKYVLSSIIERLGLSESDALALAPRIYQTFFRNALEMASIPYLSRNEIDAKLQPRGLDYLRAALNLNRGVIIVSAHYGLWELIPPWLVNRGFSMTVVVRRQNNSYVDNWMRFMRTTHGVKITDSGFGLRESLRALKLGNLLGLMSDQDAGDKGIFVPFLGKLASTVVGPAQISLKTGAPIIVVAAHPNVKPPHDFEISQPIYPQDYLGKPQKEQLITIKFTKILERWIKSRPEQWFWLHRRWKTRPKFETLK